MSRTCPSRSRRTEAAICCRPISCNSNPRHDRHSRSGCCGIDRMLQERPERFLVIAGSLLPAVERIDAALVPEMFWRGVAARTPVVDPRIPRGSVPGRLIAQLAWYDREVTAALLEPTRQRMQSASDLDPGASRSRLPNLVAVRPARRGCQTRTDADRSQPRGVVATLAS